MSAETIDKQVVPEHLEYIKSFVGVVGVDIRPILANTLTLEEFEQNMLEKSEAGEQRLLKYISHVEAGTMPLSMDIYINRNKLPQIITLLGG